MLTHDQVVNVIQGLLFGLLVWTLFWGFYSGAKR
jgi:hypothetical protein